MHISLGQKVNVDLVPPIALLRSSCCVIFLYLNLCKTVSYNNLGLILAMYPQSSPSSFTSPGPAASCYQTLAMECLVRTYTQRDSSRTPSYLCVYKLPLKT